MQNHTQNPSTSSATEQLDKLRNTIAHEEQQWLQHHKARLAEADRLKAELQTQHTEQAGRLELQQRQLAERAKALEPASTATTPASAPSNAPAYLIDEDSFLQLEQVQQSLELLQGLAGSAREAGSDIPAHLLTSQLTLLLTPLQNALHSAQWQGVTR